MKKQKEISLVHLDVLLEEANAEEKNSEEPHDLVVLVLDRNSVIFHEESGGLSDYDSVTIKEHPFIMAVIAHPTDENPIWRSSVRRISKSLKYKMFLCFKSMIGHIGIYPFLKIWTRTTPISWREGDVSKTPGFNN